MKKEATPLIVYKRPEVDVLSFELEQICLTGSGLDVTAEKISLTTASIS